MAVIKGRRGWQIAKWLIDGDVSQEKQEQLKQELREMATAPVPFVPLGPSQESYLRNTDVEVTMWLQQFYADEGLPMPMIAACDRFYRCNLDALAPVSYDSEKRGKNYVPPIGPTWMDRQMFPVQPSMQSEALRLHPHDDDPLDFQKVYNDALHPAGAYFDGTDKNGHPLLMGHDMRFPYTINFASDGKIIVRHTAMGFTEDWANALAWYIADVLSDIHTPYNLFATQGTKNALFSNLGNYRSELRPDGVRIYPDLCDRVAKVQKSAYKNLNTHVRYGMLLGPPWQDVWQSGSGSHFGMQRDGTREWFEFHTKMPGLIQRAAASIGGKPFKILNSFLSDRGGGGTDPWLHMELGSSYVFDRLYAAAYYSDYIYLDGAIGEQYDWFGWNAFRQQVLALDGKAAPGREPRKVIEEGDLQIASIGDEAEDFELGVS